MSEALEYFSNPLIKSQGLADPWLCRFGREYYLTGTAPTEDRLLVWSSRTIGGLEVNPPVCVWRAHSAGGGSAQLWAPELHLLDGWWFIYFTASDGRDRAHRHFVLESANPLGPYRELGLVDPLTDQYAIDGTVIVVCDQLYWLYATYDGIWIAPMKTPSRVGPQRRRIVVGDQPWERAWTKVGDVWAASDENFWIEAPQTLVHNGRTFLTYSAGHSATPHYAVGIAECLGNVMDPEAWVKHPGPAFAPTPKAAEPVLTVGHACFMLSPDGNDDWIIYHGKDRPGGDFAGRSPRAQPFTWRPDGLPDFGSPVFSGKLLKRPLNELPDDPKMASPYLD